MGDTKEIGGGGWCNGWKVRYGARRRNKRHCHPLSPFAISCSVALRKKERLGTGTKTRLTRKRKARRVMKGKVRKERIRSPRWKERWSPWKRCCNSLHYGGKERFPVAPPLLGAHCILLYCPPWKGDAFMPWDLDGFTKTVTNNTESDVRVWEIGTGQRSVAKSKASGCGKLRGFAQP